MHREYLARNYQGMQAMGVGEADGDEDGEADGDVSGPE
jgi:hypothetical protein